MEMQLILAALTASFGLLLIYPDIHIEAKADTRKVNGGTRTRVNLRKLFESIAKNDAEKAGAYRNILEGDAMMEQQAFDTVKEEIQFARQRNARNIGNIDGKASLVKRETEEKEEKDDNDDDQDQDGENDDEADGSTASDEEEDEEEQSGEDESDEPTPGTVTSKDIYESAARNDLESLKYYVERKDVPVTAMNEDEQTAAHIAAKLGHLAILEYLISRERKVIYIKDKFDQTVLHVAVKAGELPTVKFLIEQCRSNPLSPKGRLFGDTCVHLAANEGRLEVLRYLLEREKLDPNVRNKLGETPIFLAAEKMQLGIVRYLLEEQRANPTIVDNNQRNVLFQSAIKGDVEVPKYLLDQMRVRLDVNWRDNFGQTIMYRAVMYDKLNFVEYLVEKKKADMNIADRDGLTPIMKAANEGNTPIVKYLLEKGAEVEIDGGDKNSLKKLAKGKELKAYLESISTSENSTSPATGSTAHSSTSEPSDTSEPSARKRRYAEVENMEPNWAPLSFIYGAPMFHGM